MLRRSEFIAAAVAAVFLPRVAVAADFGGALRLRLVTDEADAVLSVLDERASGAVPTEEDWSGLFATEGYRRLAAREAAMRRPLDEASFRAFVLSDSLSARRSALRATLQAWSAADVSECGRRALAYLPVGSQMHAAVYPEIKPLANSFVFDLERDPGIFLYLNPDVSEVQFTYTVAHELHHVGFAQNCPTPAVQRELGALPQRLKIFEDWLGAFGEGFAVLAGAGGPAVDPATLVGAPAAPEWRTERATFAPRMNDLTAFFRRILSGTLTEDAARDAGMSFFGNQGPWYTVGWRMSVTIEQRCGRPRLIACIADNRLFLKTYNAAASVMSLPLWPDDLANAFG